MDNENGGKDTSGLRFRRLQNNIQIEDEYGKVVVHKKNIKVMNVVNGDVIVIKRFPGLTVELLEAFVERLSSLGLDKSIAVVVDRVSDVRNLDEEVMRNYGWIRKQASQENLEHSDEEE